MVEEENLKESGSHRTEERVRVLVIDDDRSIRTTLQRLLSNAGYDVDVAQDGDEAAEALASGKYSVALLDLGLPGRDGLDVLSSTHALGRSGPAVVVITARDDMASTVRAMQLGAFDYLVKPLDVDRIKAAVARAHESRCEIHGARELPTYDPNEFPRGRLHGRTLAMREIYKAIGAVSTSRATVLITGESGTGKELVAKAIHDASPYAQQPFVAANCAAFAPTLLESELFGHARGAFTGAVMAKPGRFELAGSGTLLLDEIGELSIDLQAKLLRALQERSFERVGEATPRPFLARVVAATHRDLSVMVSEGRFRSDLLYRLKVVEINMPALRDRREDISLLAEQLTGRIAFELQKPIRFIAPEALLQLESYAWPGNVRELENVLTRAVVHASGDILHAGLLNLASRPSVVPEAARAGSQTLRELERQHISHILAQTSWNKKRASEILQISRPTLDRKIEEYALRRANE